MELLQSIVAEQKICVKVAQDKASVDCGREQKICLKVAQDKAAEKAMAKADTATNKQGC